MESQEPRGKSTGKPGNTPGKRPPLAHDTKVENHTATPGEGDPQWKALGSTRVVASESDVSGVRVGSSADFTEMSPSCILGKDITTLGDFVLGHKLGEGAMGAVYKATQISFNNRIVALKILFPHVANNPKLRARLEREANVMDQLEHPNIIQAYAFDEKDGFAYIAMEYVSGQSMQKWMAQLGQIPVADAVRITLECAQALKYAHSLNMVHRDIKPDNILLTKSGRVKVADLGMVKIEDEEMSLTQTGHSVGTPWFMPLEQARNAKTIDGRSDIYALGCTLYAFLTGKPPFTGQTIVEVIQAKGRGTFPPARKMNSDVPERLDLILVKMIAREPKERYQTCDEVIKDLESLGVASTVLSFVQQKAAGVKASQEDTGNLGRTAVIESAAARTSAEAAFADVAAAPLDINVWYIQMKMPDGTQILRKYTTAQLQKMLTDGTVSPTAQASHSAKDQFRAVATYKEFQGAALSKMAKMSADKNSARTRGLFKQIEEQERQHEKNARGTQDEDTELQANVRYWGEILLKTVLPIGVGIGLLVLFVWFMARMFS